MRPPLKPLRALALVLILTLSASGALWALEAMTPAMGVVFIPSVIPVDANGHEEGGPEILINTMGLGLVFPFGAVFAFEPSVDFYTFYYLWSKSALRAVPTELSWRTAFTFGFMVGIPFSATWRISPNFDLALGLGPAFHLRYGILASGVEKYDPQDVGDVALINGFFFAKERWFTPTTFIRGQYRLTERIDFGFSARAFWPVYNFWNGSPQNLWWDEGIFGGALVIRYRFPVKAAEPAATGAVK